MNAITSPSPIAQPLPNRNTTRSGEGAVVEKEKGTMIQISHLTKRYGTRVAVDDVSFEVGAGRVTGFVGPNGAGKSTTMRMMVGLTRPDTGTVDYAGVPYTALPAPARVVGTVLDPRSMHPGRSARNHLRALGALSGITTTRVDEVLEQIGLTTASHQRVGGFSMGMRQRLALAGALLGEPDVLLLDEPSNGLDPDGIRWLRGYLRRFADDGGTVFVSSHLIGELSLFVDDLVVIGAGRIIVADRIGNLDAHERTIRAETPDRAELVHRLIDSGMNVRVDGDKVHVRGASRHEVAQIAFAHHIRLDELTETSRPLEEALVELTHSSAEFASA